jgi:renalase
MDITVVGAGIAGLAAAEELDRRGASVLLLDKGRGPGGRTSTRRGDETSFDHGAPYIEPGDPRFAGAVSRWEAEGVVARWSPNRAVISGGLARAVEGGGRLYVGVPGMNAMVRHLSRGRDVRYNVRVVAVEETAGGVQCTTEDGSTHRSDAVVITAPPVQALDLLREVPSELRLIDHAAMSPCWTVMLSLVRRLEFPFDLAEGGEGLLARVIRNTSKPGRADREDWVLQATPRWTQEHLEEQPESIIAALTAAFESLVQDDVEISHAAAHRWRYAHAARPLGRPGLSSGNLYFAGDWVGEGGLQGAFLSGLEVADRLMPVRT